jgi:thioredoxin 1
MEIGTQELKEKIQKGEKLIVDFYGSWCGPCKILKPIYEKVAKDLENQKSEVKLYTMDVDKNREMAASLGIRSVPTVKSFANGKEMNTRVGLLQENMILDLAKNLLNG